MGACRVKRVACNTLGLAARLQVPACSAACSAAFALGAAEASQGGRREQLFLWPGPGRLWRKRTVLCKNGDRREMPCFGCAVRYRLTRAIAACGRRWEDRLDYLSGSVCHMLCPCGSNHHVSPGPSKGKWEVWELPRVDLCHSTPGVAVSWVLPGATSMLGWPEPEPCSLFVSDGPTDVILSWPGICSAAVPGLFPPLARCPAVHGDAPVRALAPLPAPQSAGFAHASQMPSLCCHHCHIPDPLSLFFMPLHPRNTGARPAAVFHPPAVLTSWVASAHPWVGGRSGAGRGGSGRSG